MPQRALVSHSGRRAGDHRKLATRLQPRAPAQLAGLPDTGRIRNRLCKCGKQTALPTFAQPRRLLRTEFAAKLKPECSHLPGLDQGGSSGSMASCGLVLLAEPAPALA